MNDLIFFDKELTLWLNSFYNDYFDIFFHLYTSTLTWIPLYVVLAWVIFSRQGANGIGTVFFIALLITAADQTASSIIKPLVERYRPSHDNVLQYMVHLVNGYSGGRFGFVSSHAANTFALATFLSLVIRNRFMSWTLFIWAAINCYSRIYCGVHFVGDIVCGALIGVIFAAIAYQLYLMASLKFFVISHHNKRTLINGLSDMFGVEAPVIFAFTFWLILAVLLICTKLMVGFH